MSFEFEHRFRFSEEDYVRLNRIFSRKSRWLRVLVFSVLGISCLFWTYTLLLGVAILSLMPLLAFLPWIVAGTSAHAYRRSALLREELTYGLSESKLWLKGAQIDLRVPWRLVDVWDEREGWLRLSPAGVPSLWFPVSELKAAGVYEQVIQLCERHSLRFNSKEAKWGRPGRSA